MKAAFCQCYSETWLLVIWTKTNSHTLYSSFDCRRCVGWSTDLLCLFSSNQSPWIGNLQGNILKGFQYRKSIFMRCSRYNHVWSGTLLKPTFFCNRNVECHLPGRALWLDDKYLNLISFLALWWNTPAPWGRIRYGKAFSIVSASHQIHLDSFTRYT